jgi:hypothetical protein
MVFGHFASEHTHPRQCAVCAVAKLVSAISVPLAPIADGSWARRAPLKPLSLVGKAHARDPIETDVAVRSKGAFQFSGLMHV